MTFSGINHWAAALVAAFILLQPCQAADPEDWGGLAQIGKGEKVQIVKRDLKTVNGRFESYSQDAIVVDQKGASIAVPRQDVHRVTITGRGKRLRNLLIGAAAGAGTGLLIGQLATRERHDDWQTVASFCTIVGLGGGTAIGAAIPSHPTVYRGSTPLKQTN